MAAGGLGGAASGNGAEGCPAPLAAAPLLSALALPAEPQVSSVADERTSHSVEESSDALFMKRPIRERDIADRNRFLLLQRDDDVVRLDLLRDPLGNLKRNERYGFDLETFADQRG